MFTLPFRNLIKRATSRTLQTNLCLRAKSDTPTKPKEPEEPSDNKKLQEAAMDAEQLFLVDTSDKVIGSASKRDCHHVGEKGDLKLHRAFSVFLFNKNGDLLLHKRSAEKLTFPNCYTNSCCSHPRADIPGEEEEKDALGVKKAAQRRLNFELGIPVDKIPLEKFNYITRIMYKDKGDGQWGEHEIDYVLFLQDDLPINPNPNEISEISFVPRAGLDEYIPTLSTMTPWFKLFLQHRLRKWWDNLDKLDKIKDHKNIQKFDD